jgi:hypothetical protein
LAQNVKEMTQEIKQADALHEMLSCLFDRLPEAAAMDVLVPESRRSLIKSQPRFSKTDLESCAAVIEDEGDISSGFRALGTKQFPPTGEVNYDHTKRTGSSPRCH